MSDRRLTLLLSIYSNLYNFLRSPFSLEIATNLLNLTKTERRGLELEIQQANRLSEQEYWNWLRLSDSQEECFCLKRAIDQVCDHRSHLVQSSEKEKFYSLLDGKSVVIVGPAEYLHDKQRGMSIDSFDLVVRLNRHWPLSTEQRVDLGSRIDILYHCCNGDFSVAEQLRDQGRFARFVCWQDNVESVLLERHCLHFDIPSLDISASYREIQRLILSPPNTGTVAIQHLLTSDLAKLHITGFTFSYSNYSSSAMGKGSSAGNWKHQTSHQLAYFLKHMDSDPRLTYDKELESILKTYPAD
jgi:hypothetical protein